MKKEKNETTDCVTELCRTVEELDERWRRAVAGLREAHARELARLSEEHIQELQRLERVHREASQRTPLVSVPFALRADTGVQTGTEPSTSSSGHF